MSIINFLEMKENLEIQTYKNLDRNTDVPFSGSPRKHPYDKNRVILVSDPFTDNTFYFEFRVKDITCAEELPSIINLRGESIPMVCIWVKKRSIAIQSTPFIVDTITRG